MKNDALDQKEIDAMNFAKETQEDPKKKTTVAKDDKTAEKKMNVANN